MTHGISLIQIFNLTLPMAYIAERIYFYSSTENIEAIYLNLLRKCKPLDIDKSGECGINLPYAESFVWKSRRDFKQSV